MAELSDPSVILLAMASLGVALLDLALPRECGGCEAWGTSWCEACAQEVERAPVFVRPRVDPGVPCWALGPYSGPRRAAVLSLKERNRRDLVRPLGSAIAGAICDLRMHGHIDPPELAGLVLVPAPTRARAARGRGGDPVERFARAAASALAPEIVSVQPVLRMGRAVRDSVGLRATERAANVAGRIQFVGSRREAVSTRRTAGGRRMDRAVLLVDDVLTTGATATESVCVLKSFGVHVDGVLVVAAV